MKLRLISLFILIFVWAVTLSIAQDRVTVRLQIANSGETAADTFGVAVGGTSCIDAALGEQEQPPFPPTGTLYGIFNEKTCLGQGLKIDYHAWNATPVLDTVRFKFQAKDETQPLTISWPQGLGTNYTYLTLKSQAGDTLSMLTNTQYVVDDPSAVTFVRIIFVAKPGTGVIEQRSSAIPTEFALNQNYPNPFNPSTDISFSIMKNAFTEVIIYNVLGQKITTLVADQMTPGTYTTKWNGTDDRGTLVSSGVYYVRMIATYNENTANDNFTSLRKILLMK